jgi:hypothetical protein
LDIEIDTSAAAVEARTARLQLRLDRVALTLDVALRDAPLELRGARALARCGGVERRGERALALDVERAAPPRSRARLTVAADAGAGLVLELAVVLDAQWSGVVLELSARNASAATLPLQALAPLRWSARSGTLRLGGVEAPLRWLDLGRDADAACGWRRLGGLARWAGAGSGHADLVARLESGSAAGLTLGLLGGREHPARIELEPGRRAPLGLALWGEVGGALEPGRRTAAQRVWIGLDAPGGDPLGAFVERAAEELPVPLPEAPAVWLSSPSQGDAESIAAAARRLQDEQLPIEVACLQGTPQVPSLGALEELAARLSEQGLRAGLRLEPLGRGAGSPGGGPDPDALETLAAALARAGIDYLLLDAPEPSPTPEAWRRALRALRRGAPRAFLAAGRAPFGASLGLVDAMRIAPGPAAPARSAFRRRAAQRRSARALLARAALGGRLWLPQLGPLSPESLAPDDLTLLCVCAAACGAAPLWELPAGELPAETCRALRRLWPVRARPVRWLQAGGLDFAWSPLPEGGGLLLSLNLGYRARGAALSPAQLGLADTPDLYDAQRGSVLRRASALGPERLAPLGARLARLLPGDGAARVLGSSVHLEAGARGARAVAAPDGAAVSLELPGPREGSLLIGLPEQDRPLAVRVAFRDRLELRVQLARVEQTLPAAEPATFDIPSPAGIE